MAEEEGRDLLDAVREARGYVLPLDAALAAEDPAALAAYEGMMRALYPPTGAWTAGPRS